MSLPALLADHSASHHFRSGDAVDGGQIRWGNETRYGEAIEWANNQWNQLGSVLIVEDNIWNVEDLSCSFFGIQDHDMDDYWGLWGRADDDGREAAEEAAERAREQCEKYAPEAADECDRVVIIEPPSPGDEEGE